MNRRIFAVSAAILLSACTHSYFVELRPSFKSVVGATTPLASVRPALTFRRGTVADKREDTTRLVTFQVKVHTYNLSTYRPIQDVVFEGLRTLATGAGHRWTDTDASAIRVDLEILNVTGSMYEGLFNVGAKSSVQVKLDFVDPRTGQIMYTEVYNGSDDRTKALAGSTDLVVESISASVASCIYHVGDDAKLSEALRKLPPE